MGNLTKNHKPEGLAKVLAIGTANPDNIIYQSDCPDWYFRVYKGDHLPHLKDKLKRICEKSMIRKRHMYLTEEHLEQNPKLVTSMGSNLDIRQEMLVTAVPKLGAEAAVKALSEWGQPASRITHLIFCTSTGIDMPGADYQLAKLLGLNPNVNRFMIYQQGCFAGATALRLAKDLAESTRGARVLIVCSEITSVMGSRGPSDTHIDVIVAAALFGDGAAAVVVGADNDPAAEPALFEVVWAGQSLIPGSEGMLEAPLKETGLVLHLKKEMPVAIADGVEDLLEVAFEALGVRDWSSMFWAVHPGGPAILDKVEAKLDLKKERMRASRHVLSEYGNMSSPTVLFVLDEVRRRSAADGAATTGEGFEWGVLFGFGPGLTAETVVLRTLPFPQ